MREQLKSSLSSLLDDEADDLDVRRVLRDMDSEGVQVWQRYQLASAVLRKEQSDPTLDISAGVMAALADEPAHNGLEQAPRRPVSEWVQALWKPFGSVAVAASVTAVVILGSQQFMGNESRVPAVAQNDLQSGVVLAAPKPSSSALRPAQFGNRDPYAASSQAAPEQDVIRMSNGLEHYILQHHNLMRPGMKLWSTSWLPEGYRPARHEVSGQTEVLMYSNGASTISVSVEPLGQQKSPAGVAHVGDTLALGKRVGEQFVTVVGDVPLMIAERIASSITPLPQ